MVLSIEYGGFHGVWHRTLDTHGRLRVPTQVRDELADGAVISLPLRMTECVEIWPTMGFDEYVADTLSKIVDTKSRIRSQPRVAHEKFFRGVSTEVALDKYGRLVIPAFLCEHAQLEKAVTLVGITDHLEIWRA
jgi:MraZ protein